MGAREGFIKVSPRKSARVCSIAAIRLLWRSGLSGGCCNQIGVLDCWTAAQEKKHANEFETCYYKCSSRRKNETDNRGTERLLAAAPRARRRHSGPGDGMGIREGDLQCDLPIDCGAGP